MILVHVAFVCHQREVLPVRRGAFHSRFERHRDTAACKTAIKINTIQKNGLPALVACARTLASGAASAPGNNRRVTVRSSVIVAAKNAAFTRVRDMALDHRASRLRKALEMQICKTNSKSEEVSEISEIWRNQACHQSFWRPR
jgi:hypothetical protein